MTNSRIFEDQIVELFNDDRCLSITDIARECGVSYNRVHNVLRKKGLRIGDRNKNRFLESEEKIVADWLSGEKQEVIVARYRLASSGWIYRALNKAGIPSVSLWRQNRGREIEKDYNAGASIDELARKYGLSRLWTQRIVEHIDKKGP